MTAISKNVYFDVLDEYHLTPIKINIFLKSSINNTFHKTIKMKLTDATNDSYSEYNEDFNKNDFNKKDSKFKVSDHVRISKYKNIFSKGYTPNWS